MSLSTNSFTIGSGIAPTNPSIGCPSRNATTVGMLCTPNWPAVYGLASTSSLASRNEPARSPATFSRIGPSVRQGPHHDAHRSTTTGRFLDSSITVSRKFWSVASTTTGPDSVTCSCISTPE